MKSNEMGSSNVKTSWTKGALAALLGGILAAGCAAPVDAPAATDPGAETASYLFGRSEAEMLVAYALTPRPYDAAAWLEMNRAPFDCARFGDLCRAAGEGPAEAILEQAYAMAIDDGADLRAVDAYLAGAVQAAGDAREARGESDDVYRDSGYNYLTGGATDERVKITAYAIYPVIGTAYAKGECVHQEKGFLGIWGSTPATQTAKLQSHVESSRILYASGTTSIVSDYDFQPLTGFEVLTATASTVSGGVQYHDTPAQGWGFTSDSAGSVDYAIIVRTCCSATNGGWSTGGSFCINL